MSELSDYLEDQFINFFLRNNADTYTPAATLYLALFTADPTDAGTTTNEVSQATNSYARQAITFDDPAAGGAPNVTQNSAIIDFVDMPTATVTHYGVFDASTYQGGNMLFHGAFDASVGTTAGDTFRVAAGALTFTAD